MRQPLQAAHRGSTLRLKPGFRCSTVYRSSAALRSLALAIGFVGLLRQDMALRRCRSSLSWCMECSLHGLHAEVWRGMSVVDGALCLRRWSLQSRETYSAHNDGLQDDGRLSSAGLCRRQSRCVGAGTDRQRHRRRGYLRTKRGRISLAVPHRHEPCPGLLAWRLL